MVFNIMSQSFTCYSFTIVTNIVLYCLRRYCKKNLQVPLHPYAKITIFLQNQAGKDVVSLNRSSTSDSSSSRSRNSMQFAAGIC
jgi:hypothetical protein